MNIVYVASEVAPFIKTGGLGDVAGSLPAAFAEAGHQISVFCPLYSAIRAEQRKKLTMVKSCYVQLGWRNQYCGIYHCAQNGVDYYFLDNEYYFARGQIYGEYDDAERFAFFSKAVLDVLPALEIKPDIINCNDWQTALIPVYYNLMYRGQMDYENIKTVFTIHNIAFQGRFSRDVLEYVFGIDDSNYRSGFMVMDGDVNLMKSAIVASDAVTTVSPTYAEEIQTAYYGHGLDSILRSNSYKLHGIINGIDMDLYDPAKNSSLFASYSPADTAGKLTGKMELLKLCGLEGTDETPVIGMIGRLTDQKGLDLVEAILDELLQDDIRLIVLGKGDHRFEQMFVAAKKRHPEKISVSIMFSEDLANKIYAGSDMFLMPSKTEPCGLAQMIALSFGTIPIVRETGGLRDTVTAFVDYLGTGNGFTFHSYNAHDMLHVIRQACEVYRFNRAAWEKLVVRGMESDFSWKSSAEKYIEVYASI